MPGKKICPICKKSDKVVRIVYGFPSKKTIELYEKGDLFLGGCIIEESNPKWYCKRDKHEF